MARAPETHRQDEDSKTRSRRTAAGQGGRLQPTPWPMRARASGPCGSSPLPTGPRCTPVMLVQPLLQGIQHCLWLSRATQRRKETVLALPASPRSRLQCPQAYRGCWDVRGHHWVHSLHCRGCICWGAVGAWKPVEGASECWESRAQV